MKHARRLVAAAAALVLMITLFGCKQIEEPEQPAAKGELGADFVFTPPPPEDPPAYQQQDAGNRVYTLEDVDSGQPYCKTEHQTVFEAIPGMPGKYSNNQYFRLLSLTNVPYTD